MVAVENQQQQQLIIPSYIILQILRDVVDDIDRISLLMVNKKFWETRTKIQFNNYDASNVPYGQYKLMCKQFNYHSFREAFSLWSPKTIVMSGSEEVFCFKIPPSAERLIIDTGDFHVPKGWITNTVKRVKMVTRAYEDGAIPDTVKELDINLIYDNYEIPNTLDKLFITGFFRKTFKVGDLPSRLTELHIFYDNNVDFCTNPGSLPSTLVSLTLSGKWNDPKIATVPEYITKVFPTSSLKYLSFAPMGYFNQPLTYFYQFQQLETLKLGKDFNQKLQTQQLPPQLIRLSFPKIYTRPIEYPNIFPTSIKRLRYGGSVVIRPGYLPQDLETLTIGLQYDQKLYPGSLPSSLKTLKLMSSYSDREFQPDILPSGLKTLIFSSKGSYGRSDREFEYGSLPDTLETLILANTFQGNTSIYPNSLTKLQYGTQFSSIITQTTLPRFITSLTLSPSFSPFDMFEYVPDTLLELTMGYEPKSSSLRNIKNFNYPPHLKKLSITYGMYKVSFNNNQNNNDNNHKILKYSSTLEKLIITLTPLFNDDRVIDKIVFPHLDLPTTIKKLEFNQCNHGFTDVQLKQAMRAIILNGTIVNKLTYTRNLINGSPFKGVIHQRQLSPNTFMILSDSLQGGIISI